MVLTTFHTVVVRTGDHTLIGMACSTLLEPLMLMTLAQVKLRP